MRILALFVGIVLAAGCTSSPSTQPSTSTSGPASPVPSSEVVTPTAVVRPRATGDVGAGAVWWTGATAEMAGGVTLYDLAPEACSVAGSVGIELRDASGKALTLQVKPFGTPAPSLVVLRPGLGTPAIVDHPRFLDTQAVARQIDSAD